MGPSSSAAISTATPQVAASLRLQRGAALNTVKVAAETFQSVMFMRSSERKAFTPDSRVRNEDKPQKLTAEGVPVWSVQVVAVNWRGTAQLLTISVPMHADPGQQFTTGQPVELVGLVFGVSPKENGGFITWCSADDVTAAAGSRERIRAAAS